MRADLLLPAIAFLFGLLIGSFLNVCIARLPLDESVATPRSRCPACGHTIRWYDNIPLLSYALLRGHCRDCGAPISWRYPAVELVTGIWFALSALVVAHGIDLSGDIFARLIVHAVGIAMVGSLLIALMVIDWKHHLLPNTLTIPGILLGLIFACAEAVFLGDNEGNVILQHAPDINSANAGRSPGNIFLTGAEHLIFGRLLAAIGAFLLLFLIRVAYRAIRKRDGMGLGDAKLLAMIAAFVGLAPTVLSLFLGLMLATFYATVMLLRRQADAATRLPFGSFLCMGGLLAALYGERITDAYLALFR
ncbi:prepilin peptidase [Terriglobus roseus]|uniref:Leader peptidase (Prepilin peptidase) / N-methyltransferase n=1 Tax=Terriglobus roseus TaxID=392734 RepID=A0A1H4TLJ9_9BACT|nr:A24 family peptidase [Terriglobus roseus]SEC57376.1 leader peptidase (prepilin peptidase) / N-methyltransferase [Terriglobus roseus]